MEIQVINQAEMLSAINKSEVDIQVSTAKAYPRDVEQSLKRIKQLATIDNETAENCFYALKRGDTFIEGPSVRLAEIIGCAWGNLRVQARIIGNDGKFITAQGSEVCGHRISLRHLSGWNYPPRQTPLAGGRAHDRAEYELRGHLLHWRRGC